MTQPTTIPIHPDAVNEALSMVEDLCARYEIASLNDFLESCRSFAQEKTLNIAVLGRFKAGKSSFLNQLLGRSVLPVGVIPVTAIVTEIQWGPRERATVEFGDSRKECVSVERIGEFISENENPENSKQVACVRVELPSLERFRGIRFVDTPGLESVFEHNTESSLEWLPNVGLALVAVGVDPPLSQHDIELIRSLSRYTPNISLLLTKVDVLEESERVQVREFVRKQLARYWNDAVPVYPYSVRPGFEGLRADLDDSLLSRVREEAGEQRAAILRHKLDSLLSECADYLNVALKAAEVADSEREALRRKILGQHESLEDSRLALKLIVRHAIGNTRPTFEALLRPDELSVRNKLEAGLSHEFPAWARSLRVAIEKFDDWLCVVLTREMAELSRKHRNEFVEPVRRVGRQLSQSLQDFRNRLSERMLETLGVPLRTTEMELHTDEPKSPDIRVGKIFDRNWELLSWLLPMWLVKGFVLKHYHGKVEDLVFANLSRLANQWQEIVNASLSALEMRSIRRLEGLIATIEKLIASAGQQAPQIREDIQQLEELRHRLNGGGA
jgi:GTP-binding protein EngB required for normal cell division